MKKTILILVLLVLVSSLVIAKATKENKGPDISLISANDDIEQDDGDETEDGLEQDSSKGEKALIKTQEQKENKGELKETIQERKQIQKELKNMVQEKARNKEELKEMIQKKKQELEQKEKEVKPKQKETIKNQNKVKLAVHSLLAMEDLTGGIGKQVSEIAKEFNNGVDKTLKAEVKLQKKSKLKKFLTGGDKETAEEIEEEVKKSKERIKKLKKLKETCEDCEEEVKEMFQEQIQNIEQEQTRLQKVAQKEKKKGLFGWLFK